MTRWTCPACGREFARTGQSHVCVPAGTVDEAFAGKPPYQRAAFDAIMLHLDSPGPVHMDAVSVGVFLKRERKMAEVRPLARSLTIWLRLDRPATHRCLSRTYDTWHVFKLTSVDDVDERLRSLLTEAFLLAGD